MDDSRSPALRASDADRERAADSLRQAAGDGRLTLDELDQRLSSAYAARTRAELEQLVADVLAPEVVARAAERMPVRHEQGGTRWVVALMGGSDRKGRWRLAPRCTVVNIMGGSDLDLNDAELSAERSELRVFALMGGADVYVPEGLNVEVSEFAFMGGSEIDARRTPEDPGAPVLRVRFFSLMGGSSLRRGRKQSRRRGGHLGH